MRERGWMPAAAETTDDSDDPDAAVSAAGASA